MYIYWGAASVKKRDLDKWMRKKLMKFVLCKDVDLYLSNYAARVITERNHELTLHTLTLIVALGAPELIKCVLNVLPQSLLEKVALSTAVHHLTLFLTTEQFKQLIPLLLRHEGNLNKFVARRIVDLEPEAFTKYKSFTFMEDALITNERCPLELFQEILNRNPKHCTCSEVKQQLIALIVERKLKVVL